MSERFGMITEQAFPLVGVVLLIGIGASFLAVQFVDMISLVVGGLAFGLLLLKGIDRRFDIRGGGKGGMSLVIVGAILMAVGLGAFGLDLSGAVSSSLGSIIPALGNLLSTVALGVGAGMITWGALGTLKELT